MSHKLVTSSMFAGAVVLLACSPKVATTELDASQTASGEPRVPSGEQEGVAVRGRIVGHDGQPLSLARVELRRGGFKDGAVELSVDAEGHVEGRLPEAGVWWVRVTGVDHADLRKALLVTGELSIEGRLGTYARSTPEDELGLAMQFLDANDEPLSDRRALVARRTKGETFAATLPSPPEGAVALRYQITSLVEGRTFNGPKAERWAYDGGGDYWSIVDLGGGDSLSVDLAQMVPAGVEAQIEWAGIDADAALLTERGEHWATKIGGEAQASRQRSPKLDGPDDVAKKALEQLKAEALHEAEAATTPTRRALLRLAQLCNFAPFMSDEELRAGVEWMVAEIEPTEPRLPLIPSLDNVAFAAYQRELGVDQELDAFLDRLISEHADPGLVVDVLGVLLWRAEEAQDQPQMDALFAQVADERFAGTYSQAYLLQIYDPDRVLKPGNAFPDFDFPSLADPNARVTKADHDGTVYLVEFWATWCGPCRKEMPKLHAAYAELNGMKLPKDPERLRKLSRPRRPRVEFVFLSFDSAPDEVASYRAEQWSMPWVHGFVPPDQHDEVYERFGFSSIPTAILLDEEGTIIATRSQLRGDRLLPTLREALGDPPPEGSR